jgi:hypothetical protein
MPVLDLEALKAYRQETYFLLPELRLRSPEAALDFVNARGFVYFWPIQGVDLPSLWAAVAGDRPVADAHDDPGHVSWGWKDAALPKRIWYYGKILRRKATIISLETAPYFYALSENYGSPEEDHILAYEAGHLTLAAKQVYDALLENGRMNTLDLRKEARLQNAKESEFNRALEDLQKDFKVLPVGVAEVGAWRYAFQYELTARHFPDLPERARPIGEAEARRHLTGLFFRSVGAAQRRDVNKLFGWPPELVRRTLDRLVQDGLLAAGVEHPKQPGEWLALPELIRGG